MKKLFLGLSVMVVLATVSCGGDKKCKDDCKKESCEKKDCKKKEKKCKEGCTKECCKDKKGVEGATAIIETNNDKEFALKAEDALFKNYDVEEVKKLFKEDYIQHNPYIKTGLEPILSFLPALKEGGLTYKTHRILQDGNFIITHNTYDNAEAFGTKEIVTFDLWRLQDGKVAEHWDAVIPKATPNPSNRTQIDGFTQIEDLVKQKQIRPL